MIRRRRSSRSRHEAAAATEPTDEANEAEAAAVVDEAEGVDAGASARTAEPDGADVTRRVWGEAGLADTRVTLRQHELSDEGRFGGLRHRSSRMANIL